MIWTKFIDLFWKYGLKKKNCMFHSQLKIAIFFIKALIVTANKSVYER